MKEKFFVINDIVIIDVLNHILLKNHTDGEKVLLNRPAFMCLIALIKNENKIVSHEDLLNTVWGNEGRYVTHNTLYQNISLARKGLRLAGMKENVIRTIPRKGFSFCGRVAALEDLPQGNPDKNKPVLSADTYKDDAISNFISFLSPILFNRYAFWSVIFLAAIIGLLGYADLHLTTEQGNTYLGLNLINYEFNLIKDSINDLFNKITDIKFEICELHKRNGSIDFSEEVKTVNKHSIYDNGLNLPEFCYISSIQYVTDH